jgi:nucleotide-binding universal stress UspA family protein
MFPRVLFPTDLSQHAWELVDCLADLKAIGTQEIVVLYVVGPTHAVGMATDYLGRALQWKAEAERCLEAVRQKVIGLGLRATCRVEVGSPDFVINQVAADEAVSLIAMGTHGHGFVKGALIGSVTHEVVQHAPVPVLVMKLRQLEHLDRRRCDAVCSAFFRRVLLPVDFSACSNEAVRLVKRFDSAVTDRVFVLHVLQPPFLEGRFDRRREDSERAARERLEQIGRELAFFGLNATALLRAGDPFHEIVELCNQEDVSLIVIGSKGRSALADVLLGSVSDAVVRHHPRPVLVVRGEGACAAAAGLNAA